MHNLFIEYLDPKCPVLKYHSAEAAGLDLPAGWNPDNGEGAWLISPGKSLIIDVPIKLAIPEEHYGRVVLRSGHGFKRDLSCHVGTIDADYRGQVRVKVFNHSSQVQRIEAYERFAQLIIQPYVRPRLVAARNVAAQIPADRGVAGFGSTGQ